MFKKHLFFCFFFLLASVLTQAQNETPYFKDALTQNRLAFYRKMVRGVYKNLEKPLSYTTEQDWKHAFSAINLIKYNTTLVNNQLDSAVKYANLYTNDFKIALLELIHSDYPTKYTSQIIDVFKETDDALVMAMAANYILNAASDEEVKMIKNKTNLYISINHDNDILKELVSQIKSYESKETIPSIKPFFDKKYLAGQMLVFSFQRSNRNYAGLAMVRRPDGNFVMENDSTFFSVGQLARSASNMPGYISNGNTPQGIFRINGFDKSSSYFIGPTTNVQLVMPLEKPEVFFQVPTDAALALLKYGAMLPSSFKKYHPMFGSYYASKIGRTEIIAHGTSINPDYYKTFSYFPYTPTAGCLATQEFWNQQTGYIEKSDQLLLNQAINKTGTNRGYLIVIDIDDKKAPVTVADVIEYLK